MQKRFKNILMGGFAAVFLLALFGWSNVGSGLMSSIIVYDESGSKPTCASMGSSLGWFCAENGVESEGDLDVAGAATFSGALSFVTQTVGVDFNDMRVFDNLAALLPVAAADDDMGNVPGTPGTTAPSLQGVDFGGTATDEKAEFKFVMPSTYTAGSTVTLRLNAGMLTTISDGTATLDAKCWVPDYANADGTVSTDLVTPAAQSINSLTLANIDFVIDDDLSGHALAAGSVLQCQLLFAGSDTTNAGVMAPIIRKIDVVIST